MLRCEVARRQREATNKVVDTVVVNTPDEMVVNRTKDRHKKTPGRAAYMREYMRKRRGV